MRSEGHGVSGSPAASVPMAALHNPAARWSIPIAVSVPVAPIRTPPAPRITSVGLVFRAEALRLSGERRDGGAGGSGGHQDGQRRAGAPAVGRERGRWPRLAWLLAGSLTPLSYPAAALVSRQFVDMSRIRIEGLLAAFPKLVGTGKQHTYVETENVRYLYQPIEVRDRGRACSALQSRGGPRRSGQAGAHSCAACLQAC